MRGFRPLASLVRMAETDVAASALGTTATAAGAGAATGTADTTLKHKVARMERVAKEGILSDGEWRSWRKDGTLCEGWKDRKSMSNLLEVGVFI